ncbi:MAG: hypothetical protein GY705_05075 [Bacteroidetes bacterium]|nr:hypothetical protein [Bacteroidota bacterium]
MKFLFIPFIIVLSVQVSLSQEAAANSGNALLVKISYGAQRPGGHLSDRFGNNLNVGGGAEWITAKNNFLFGLDGGFLFGNTVKQDVLANLRTEEGSIISNDRVYANIELRERGIQLGVFVGKLFSLSNKNPRSGIRITVGGGLLQHKIRIQDDPIKTVSQLSGEYKKGYDRLTNGFALTEFIGYQILSANRQINFYAGFEFVQGFTKDRRDWDYYEQQKLEVDRLDQLYGFKVGWILPFYIGQNPEEIYY